MFKTIFSLSSLTIAGYIVSLVNQIIITSALGTSVVLDSYFYALTLVAFFYFYTSAWSEAVVPTFFKESEKGKLEASIMFSKMLNTILVAGVISSVFLLFFLPALISNFVSSGNMEHLQRIESFSFVLTPIILLTLITSMFSSILNSRNKFLWQQLAKITGVILSCFLTWKYIDQHGPYAIAYATLLSLFMLLVGQLIEIKGLKLGYHIKYGFLKDQKFYKVFSALCFTFFVLSIIQIFEKWTLDRFQGGTIAAYGHAQKLFHVAIQVLISSMIGVIWTRHMNKIKQDGEDSALQDLISVAAWGFGFTCVVATVLFVFGEKILYLLLFQGRFDLDSLAETTKLFRPLILAIPFIALYNISNRYILTIRHSRLLGLTNLLVAIGFFMGILMAYIFHDPQYVALSQLFGYTIASLGTLLVIRSMAMKHVFRHLVSHSWYWVVWSIICGICGHLIQDFFPLIKIQLLWRLPLVMCFFFSPIIFWGYYKFFRKKSGMAPLPLLLWIGLNLVLQPLTYQSLKGI